MWKYVKKYLVFAVLAGLFMVCEVLMDLLQPELMSRIVDEGVLGIGRGGMSSMELIWNNGFKMIGLVLFGGFCGAASNVFIQMASQYTGNEIRKDSFKKIMTYSFSQVDRFGTGSLVVRLTNDITQVQNLVSHFVRGGCQDFDADLWQYCFYVPSEPDVRYGRSVCVTIYHRMAGTVPF